MLRLRFGTSPTSQFWIQYLSFHLSPWCVRICSLNKQNWEGGRRKMPFGFLIGPRRELPLNELK